MKIKAEKITNLALMQWACSMTIDADTNIQLDNIYKNEHSPMRTQLFKVEMISIPSFVSVHFVRHTQGVMHFCKTLRDDRGATGREDRWTPTNHGMIVNAQALVNMARKRLCSKSHKKTVEVMEQLRATVSMVDPCLADYMVPECVYRGGRCFETKPCYKYKEYKI